MGSRRSKDMGSQWGNLGQNDVMPSIDEETTEERLEKFYFSLPRPKQLKCRAISRIQEQKVQNYVSSALHDLVEFSEKAEDDEIKRQLRLKQRLRHRLRPQLLDQRRFKASDFVNTRLNLPLTTYLKGIPRSWGDEIAVLEANAKANKIINQPRTKVIKTPLLNIETRCEWVQEVQKRLQDAQSHAMLQKISPRRRKDIRSELSDFDLISRPTHFLHLESQIKYQSLIQRQKSLPKHLQRPDTTDIIIGSQSARDILKRLPTLISKQSLDSVLRKDEHMPFSEAGQHPNNHPEFDHIFDVKEAIKDLKNMPDAKNFCIDVEPKPQLHPASGDSMFELTCLRDLVDITEGSGWEKE